MQCISKNSKAFATYFNLLLSGCCTIFQGFQDFIPDKTIRSKDNRGYELFSDVMDRAGQWIAQQRGVRFTNVQTVPIKIKKREWLLFYTHS